MLVVLTSCFFPCKGKQGKWQWPNFFLELDWCHWKYPKWGCSPPFIVAVWSRVSLSQNLCFSALEWSKIPQNSSVNSCPWSKVASDTLMPVCARFTWPWLLCVNTELTSLIAGRWRGHGRRLLGKRSFSFEDIKHRVFWTFPPFLREKTIKSKLNVFLYSSKYLTGFTHCCYI